MIAYFTGRTMLGEITVFTEADRIIALEWGRVDGGETTALITETFSQIRDYLDGKRQTFDLDLAPKGTAFQNTVWSAMSQIPYGETRSYGALAKTVNSGPRAIGGACRSNPIPIIIPCHRVMSASGKLHGYSGGDGLETKALLLRIEGIVAT